jgi:hypothetical protein
MSGPEVRTLGDLLPTCSSAILHLFTDSSNISAGIIPYGLSMLVSDEAQVGKTQPWSLPNVVACLAKTQYDAMRLAGGDAEFVKLQVCAHEVKHFGAGRIRFQCYVSSDDGSRDELVSVWFFAFLDSDAKLSLVRQALELDAERGIVRPQAITVAKIAQGVYFAIDPFCFDATS